MSSTPKASLQRHATFASYVTSVLSRLDGCLDTALASVDPENPPDVSQASCYFQ